MPDKGKITAVYITDGAVPGGVGV